MCKILLMSLLVLVVASILNTKRTITANNKSSTSSVARVLFFATAQPLGSQVRLVGSNLFSANPGLEASGLVWIPDAKSSGNGLLAGVDDSGSIFMVNPEDDEEYYVSSATGKDLEGITYDPFLFSTTKHVYVVEEGNLELIRYSYILSDEEDHDLTLVEDCITDLSGALPCLTATNQGLESLALFSPSSPGIPAQFLVGLQSNGAIYRVDATGVSSGLDSCIDVTSTLGVSSDISATQYDASSDVLYTIFDSPRRLAAIDVSSKCLLGSWLTTGANYEGFSIHDGSSVAYIAADDSPSSISEFEWTPTDILSCPNPSSSCSFSICDSGVVGGPSACSAPSTSNPTPSPTQSPTSGNVTCSDSTEKFLATKPGSKGWTKMKTCAGWVDRASTAWRCRNVGGVKEACPKTCLNCCVDSEETFTLKNGENKTCEWAGLLNTNKRCRKPPTRQKCAVTCGECD